MLQIEDLYLQVGDFRLKEIHLQVAHEEYFVLMGPTGSGKSLLIKCLCGLIRPSAGRIFMEGDDITSLEPRFRRIGYVPQDGGLFPHVNVAKNITFPQRVRGRSHAKALEQIEPLIETLSVGSLLDRSTVNLSGGERQKVALARALGSEPKLLVLDEPVSALDEPTRREICHELRRVQKELLIPTIHVCHSVVEARLVSDNVGVIVAGQLVQTGTLEEIIRKPAGDDVERLLDT